MAAGYVYVLANSSMPDLVKIGKTTKHPAGRAQELSGATGVPTPFIVVYELAVSDCDRAEEFIHTLLARKEYRVSDKREFFRASIPEVIEAILALPAELRNTVNDEASPSSNVTVNSDPTEAERPWWSLWQQAEYSYFGWENALQDYEEAYRLFRDAAKLGCYFAYSMLGTMHRFGEGVPKDIPKAIAIYKEGTKKGNYDCWLKMARLFVDDDRKENANKCVAEFLRVRGLYFDGFLEEQLSTKKGLVTLIGLAPELFGQLAPWNIAQLRYDYEALLVENSKIGEEGRCESPNLREYIRRIHETSRQWLLGLKETE